MRKRPLSEMVKIAKQTKFSMPPEVECEKTQLPDGRIAYIFRHHDLGQIGRLFFLPHAHDQTQCVFEVTGDEDDPMTQKRKEIFAPIAKDIVKKMEIVGGPGLGTPKPYQVAKERHTVGAEIMPCHRCRAPAVHCH